MVEKIGPQADFRFYLKYRGCVMAFDRKTCPMRTEKGMTLL